ncbi:hypothetical protein V6N13_114764 [Hibiscus sabdariffa]|uniref:Transmembrane protein n=1 Tax=Hibiscus sabdariffa TaxID=183260 RepID=A0ABR2U3I5_9ROSI
MSLGKLVLVSLVLVVVHAMADHESGVEPKPSEVYKAHNKDGQAGYPEPAETPSPAESREAEAPEMRPLGRHHHHHHSSDMSVAGGGVIVGGIFFSAIFASVFAYIRVTRERVDVKH